MPTTSTQQDLVPKVPNVPKKRDGDVIVSRSKRKALANAITTITLRVDGTYVVANSDGEVWSETKKFAEALRVARFGPASEDES
jgi:hypothetical protein